jgi:uncharacterized damage-inducible protein DinB
MILMSLATDVLLASLDEAYERRGWHGPTLRRAIAGLTAEEVLVRPAPGRHNIWEVTAHCAYWKFVVRRRLTGDRALRFPLRGTNWFPPEAASWREVVAMLDAEHRLLREVIAACTDRDVRDSKRRRMIAGVAAHDVYHTGQIQLLRRLIRA